MIRQQSDKHLPQPIQWQRRLQSPSFDPSSRDLAEHQESESAPEDEPLAEERHDEPAEDLDG